jgi:TPR repeat protein
MLPAFAPLPFSTAHAAELHASTSIFAYVARGDKNQLFSWVQEGGELDMQDSRGNTPLMLAAEDGKVEMVAILLQNGADPNKANLFGYTPLWAAVTGKHAYIISLLIDAGADSSLVNRYGSSVDDYVKSQGYESVLQYANENNVPPQIKQGPNSAGHIALWEKRANVSIQRGEYAEAERILKVTAEGGDPYAQYMLGAFYMSSGYTELAVVSLAAAAEAGVLAAQIELSSYYLETASREPINIALGFKYQKMAADNWYPPAILETGKCYMYGVGTQANQDAAYRYFRLAAKLEMPDAYYFMGAQRYYNLGADMGLSEIISAADAGSAEAKAQLLRFKTEDIFEALIKVQSKDALSDYLLTQGAVLMDADERCDYYDITKATHPDYGVYRLAVCKPTPPVDENGAPSLLQLVFNVYKDVEPTYKEFLINYQLKRANVLYVVDETIEGDVKGKK